MRTKTSDFVHEAVLSPMKIQLPCFIVEGTWDIDESNICLELVYIMVAVASL